MAALLKEITEAELESIVPLEQKTLAMIKLERRYGVPITLIIKPIEGITVEEQAKSLGIGKGTLVGWRQRFNIHGGMKPGPKPRTSK